MAKVIKKAQQTKQELLNSACDLFSRNWYETVSISEISKHAGKSSGSFYNYFKSKEDIFLALLDSFLIIFGEEMGGITGETVEARLDSFFNITIKIGKKYKKLVTLFREGQYRYNEMEKRLRGIYMNALYSVYGRELSESEYLFVTGPLRFISIRNLYHKRPYDINTLKSIILNGLYPDDDFGASKVFTSYNEIVEDEKKATRDILLSTAMKLFGEEGYHQVNVYDITRKSRFAVGTFYRHFESKELMLEELVEHIGSETRSLISKNLRNDLNPLETTIQGFFIFIKILEKNPAFYTIVREAEFVLEEKVEEYYNRFENGYLNQPCPENMDTVTVANALSGIVHYFGIEDIFSRNIKDIESILSTLSTYLQSGISH